jgi:hypothetical protein
LKCEIEMKVLIACLTAAALLLPAVSSAADSDTPPSVAPPASQSGAPKAPQAQSKLHARFTTQWSGGGSTAPVKAEGAPRVAPRADEPAEEAK